MANNSCLNVSVTAQFVDVDNGKEGEDNEDEPQKDLQKKVCEVLSQLEFGRHNLHS